MSDGRGKQTGEMGMDESTDEKRCGGGRARMNYFTHPTLISIFLTISYHCFPLKIFTRLRLHLLAEHADQGDIERGTER